MSRTKYSNAELKFHVKRIRFVATPTQQASDLTAHLRLANELAAMGCTVSIRHAANNQFVDLSWAALPSVSFAQLLKKY